MKLVGLKSLLLAGSVALSALVSTQAQAQSTQCVSNALAGGTVDAIVIPRQPCGSTTNLLILTLAGANTIANPTLQQTGFAALPIYDNQGNNPGIGALPGAGAVVLLAGTGSSWLIVSGNPSTVFSGTLAVANGGTGVATIPTNQLVVGQGTGAISTVTAGTTGQVLVGNTSSPPSFSNATSVAVTSLSFGGTGLTPNSATQGAITVGGTLDEASGGTGLTSYAVGDLIYASGTTTLAKLPDVATGNALISGGIGVAPSYGKIGLTTHVSGTLPTTSGGTGLNSAYTDGQLLIGNTSTGFLNAATLTAGSNMIITNAGGSITLASTGVSSGCGTLGSSGQVLTDNGSGGCDSNSTVTISGGTLAASSSFNLSGASSALQVNGSPGTAGQPLLSAGAGTTPTYGTLSVAGGGSGATTLTGVLKGNGTSAFTAATAGTDYVAPATATTFTAKQTFSGGSSTLAAALVNAAEPATVSATAATGTINYDVCTQSILYYTSNAAANWTLNIRCSSGTSLDSAMAVGDVVTIVFLVTQGGTAYYNNALTIDSSSVTPDCPNGSCPTAGNINGIDSYTYAIIKTGSATFKVLETLTPFT